MKKLLPILLIFMLLPSLAFANGEKESATKEVNIWSFNLSPEALAEVQDNVIASYQEMHPEVTINWQNIPYAGYREKLLTSAAGSALPDVFIDGFNMVGVYENAGIIEDLSNDIEMFDFWSEFTPSVVDLAKVGDKVYGIPFRLKVYPTIINTELFEQAGLDPENPPTTWDDVLAAGKKIFKAENGSVVTAGASNFYNQASMARTFDLLVQQDGGQLLDEDGNPAFNDEHGMNALKFLIELYNIEKPVGLAPIDETVNRVFVLGKAGMSSLNSYDSIQSALQTGEEDIIAKTKVVMPMRSNNPTGKNVAMFDGDMAYVSSSSDVKAEALDFLDYFYQPDNLIIYLKANKCVPFYAEHLDSAYMDENPLYKDLYKLQEYGGVLAKTAAYRAARGYLTEEIEKAIYDGQGLQETLDKAESRWLQEIEDMK
jgi:ABC-type glycerol-3-phosphate transport system substrate-binding protein